MHRPPQHLTALVLILVACAPATAHAKSSGPKIPPVPLGAIRRVPYTPAYSTPDSKDDDSTTLRIRALFVDERQKEWTTGELHNVTDRSFAIRRALHINDALPTEPTEHWTWQPGPWLLVDRTTGHITPLHLPDFDPAVSNAVWFRDYAAYCGISSPTTRATRSENGKPDAPPATLVAVVAQASARKAVAQRPLGKWPQPDHTGPACKPATWQRLPMRATLTPTTGDPITFDVVGTTALIEDADNDD